MGREFRVKQFPQLGNEFSRGQFLFNGQFTNTITPTGANTATQSGGYTGADFSNHEWATYFDDTWRVSPNLTVTLGLRWEVMQPLLDKSGHEVDVQLNQSLPNAANVQDLSKHRFTSARAAGLFTTTSNSASTLLGHSQHWRGACRWLASAANSQGRPAGPMHTTYGFPAFSYNNFIDTSALPVTVPIGFTWGGNSHLPTSSSMQYMLNVQRTLAKATIPEVGYVGSQSRRLGYLVNQNQGILNASLPVVQRLPYPEWGASGIQWLNGDANGSYNAFSGKLPQRFGVNLSALLSYSWSKSLDATSNIRGMVGSTFSPQDARCPVSCEKAPRISTFRNGSPL